MNACQTSMSVRGHHPFTSTTRKFVPSNPDTRRHTWIYGVGAVVALGFAFFPALGLWTGSQYGEDVSDVVAYVNGQPIPQTEYARALEAMQSGLTRTLTPEDRARARDMLVREELIVQDSLRLGLAQNDRLVRKNLVQAMMRSVASLDTDAPTESELEAFFEQEKQLFASPPLYTFNVASTDDSTAATQFKSQMGAGGKFREVAVTSGLTFQYSPAAIPIGKVNDLFGGAVAATLSRMQPGDVAGPLESQGKSLFVWLQAKHGGTVTFEDARDQVQAEMRRRAEEAALERYINRLQRGARIHIVGEP